MQSTGTPLLITPNGTSNQGLTWDSQMNTTLQNFNHHFEAVLKLILEGNHSLPENNPVVKDEQNMINLHVSIQQLESLFKNMRSFVRESSMLPSLSLKKEVQELEAQVQRKDAILDKYSKKIAQWEASFANLQQPIVSSPSSESSESSTNVTPFTLTSFDTSSVKREDSFF